MKSESLKPFLLGVVLVIFGIGLIVWSVQDVVRKGADTATDAPTELPTEGEGEVCIQVITPAKNPETGEVVDYPTPCAVPEGWEVQQPNVTE